MSWRIVVISSRAKLDLKMNYLVVRGETLTKVHLSEISILMIESTAVSLTASLLAEMSRRKIKVIFCDEKRNPSAELVPYYGSHDTSGKIREQICWTDSIKGAVWTEIISEKIRMQSAVLKSKKKSEAELLDRYINEMEFADTTNREGHAAKVYFNAIFGMGFTRTADTNINAALNYGYSIIMSAFSREISALGYITQLGLWHNNQFNQFNLASDLMEPFRPIVDARVIKLKPEKFEHEEKMQVLEIMNHEVIIEDRKQQVDNAIKIYTKSIFNALSENDVSLIRFYRNEL